MNMLYNGSAICNRHQAISAALSIPPMPFDSRRGRSARRAVDFDDPVQL